MKASKPKGKKSGKSAVAATRKTKAAAAARRNGSARAPKSLASLNRWMRKNEELLIQEATENSVRLTGKRRF